MTQAVGCAGADDPSLDAEVEEDLTSLTARQRTLKFSGVVFVDEGADDSRIIQAIRKQTQSAFGALREADIGVNSRELKDVDPTTFVKTVVTVKDPANPSAPTTKRLRVSYVFTDSAVVPVPVAARSSIQLALLTQDYATQTERVFNECTLRDQHATEFRNGSLWYVFNPALAQCKTAIQVEQKKIDEDRAKVGNAPNIVPKSEAERLYVPATMALGRAANNTKLAYPEYDRLFSGGVEPGKLVIGMVSGEMADWAAGERHEPSEDAGYPMWHAGLREIFKARPGFTLKSVEPAVDALKYTVGTTQVSFASFDDLLAFELDDKNPTGITFGNREALRAAIASKLIRHWLTFEAPVQVTIKGVTKPVTLKLQSYFGATSDSTPHKKAIKTSDLFVYNGHSYIGYGPLDPSRFTSADFPKSYQVMMINGCVSYNYYEKDYKPLKEGGTKNLDLVTNGLESWVNESGDAMGRFVGAFIDGKTNSYQDILKAAQFTGYGYSWGQDALRVVDGELDNKYKPSATPITIR
jgi:hypothetical protein